MAVSVPSSLITVSNAVPARFSTTLSEWTPRSCPRKASAFAVVVVVVLLLVLAAPLLAAPPSAPAATQPAAAATATRRFPYLTFVPPVGGTCGPGDLRACP